MENKQAQPEISDKQAAEQFYAFVIAEMKAGSDKTTIVNKLVEKGVDRAEASKSVYLAYDAIMKTAEQEQFQGSSILPGLAGGIIAALAGGIVWGLIAIFANYELGILAWGIGYFCGFLVVMFSGRKRGIPLQIVAMLCSVFGILTGKYLCWFKFVKDDALKQFGAEVASTISVFSINTITAFFSNLKDVVHVFDLIWFALAIYTAWNIPKAIGVKTPKDGSNLP